VPLAGDDPLCAGNLARTRFHPHNPGRPVETAQDARRTRDVPGGQESADLRGRAPRQQLDAVGGEAVPGAEPAQQRHVAGPAVAEAGVLAHHDVRGAQGPDQDVEGELDGRRAGRHVVEREDEHRVRPVLARQLGPALDGREGGGVPRRAGDRRGMGVEGHEHDRQAAPLPQLDGTVAEPGPVRGRFPQGGGHGPLTRRTDGGIAG
jgi:hypothetical protein